MTEHGQCLHPGEKVETRPRHCVPGFRPFEVIEWDLKRAAPNGNRLQAPVHSLLTDPTAAHRAVNAGTYAELPAGPTAPVRGTCSSPERQAVRVHCCGFRAGHGAPG